jgi:hypothetical protein
VQSYTSNIDGSPVLTVYGKSDGAGGVTNLGVGIKTTDPTAALEVQGTASASYFLTNNTFQVGGLSSVSYNRIGTSTTGHSNYISASNDLSISGDLEVRASLSIGGTASVSGSLIVGNGLSGTSIGLIANNGTSTGNIFEARDNGTAVFTVQDGAIPTYLTSSRMVVGTSSGPMSYGQLTVYNNSASVDAALVIAQGNVAASEALVLYGGNVSAGLTQYGSSVAGTTFGLSSAGLLHLSQGDISASGILIGPSTADPVYFATNSTVRMTIGASGGASLSTSFEITSGTASISSTLYLGGNPITGTASTSAITISNLEVGATEFAANSGIVSWMDMAISSASRGTVESYTAQLDGNPMFTVFGKSDGVGGIGQPRIGLGTLSPWAPFAMVASDSQSAVASTSFAIRSTGTIGSIASLSGTSLVNGGVVMQFTVPASTSASAGYLLVKDSAGAIYASLGYGGRLTLARDIRSDGATSNCTATNTPSAGCIDFAESFPSADATITAGDIVAVNPASASQVVKATGTNVALGVVSTNPGILLTGIGVLSGSSTQREAPAHTVPVALAGRVPVRVTDENGTIEAGDHLTVSATVPGSAMKQTSAGMSVGIALEGAGTGRVMVFVQTAYWAPTVTGDSLVALDGLDMDAIFTAVVARFTDLLDITFSNGRIKTNTLCLDDVCIDKDQLRSLLQNQGIATPTPTPTPSATPDASPTPTPTPDLTPTPSPLTPSPTPLDPSPTPESTPELTPSPLPPTPDPSPTP